MPDAVNETQTLTISEFLRKRLREREEIALKAAGWDRTGSKRANGRWIRTGISSVDGEDRQSVIYSDSGQVSESVADHVTANDPAFVLEDIMSKRAIVDRCERIVSLPASEWEYSDAFDLADATLRLLAAPYRRHPDYREEWT